ncbi:hypothetical protein VTL71DRAFT_1974 [Oculimacula yallundae]|uniref:Uncharacterized protein n=1 Tax=Oculimacula yallundae TaxID=86028 RepID=A0ABR4CEH0_9HELO
MYNLSRDHQQNIFLSAPLSERVQQKESSNDNRSKKERFEHADIKDSAASWVDSNCATNWNKEERWQAAITSMKRHYLHPTKAIIWTCTENEEGYRKLKLGRRTKKVISFGIACMCAAQLHQKPWERTKTETNEIEQPQRGSAYESIYHHAILSNVWAPQQKNYTSLVERAPIPNFLAMPHPHLLLIATIVFAFPITYLRYTNRKDKYQDEILVGCMILIVTAASMFGDVWEMGMSLLPWSIVLGLVVSSMLHWAFGFHRRKVSCEESAEKT